FDLLMFRSRVVILRKRFAEESLHDVHVVPLVGLARVVAFFQPQMSAAPESRASRRGVTTVEMAARLRPWAARQKKFLVEYGYPADFLLGLDDAIAAVRECERERITILLRRRRAVGTIAAELRNGSRCVAMLGALVRPV